MYILHTELACALRSLQKEELHRLFMFNSAMGVSFSSGILRRPYKCIYSLYAQYSQTETAKRLGYKKCTEPVFIGDLAHWKILGDFKTKRFFPISTNVIHMEFRCMADFCKNICSFWEKMIFFKEENRAYCYPTLLSSTAGTYIFLKLTFHEYFLLPSGYLLATETTVPKCRIYYYTAGLQHWNV